MTTESPAETRTPARFAQRLRRWVVGVIIVSFGIAALGGIIVLLGGDWTETTGQVLGTTGLTGAFSVAVLCGASLFGRPAQWFGWATVTVSIVTLILLVAQLWSNSDWGELMFKFDVTLVAISAAAAVASLLLLLVNHRRQSVRVFLFVTLGLIAVAVFFTILPIWEPSFDTGDDYWRFTGIAWILAALGVVVLPVASLILRGSAEDPPARPAPEPLADGATAAPAPAPAPASAPAPTPALSDASLERITAAAREQGVSPDELISRLLP